MLGFWWICLSVAFIVFGLTLLYYHFDWGIDSGSIALGIVHATMAAFASIALLTLACIFFEEEPYEIDRKNIYAIEDNIVTSGQFALGFGSIEGESYYYYVEEDKQGFKQVKKANTEDTKIKDNGNGQPYIIKYGSKYKSKLAEWIYGDTTFLLQYYTYEIHVPEKAITKEFNIDLR